MSTIWYWKIIRFGIEAEITAEGSVLASSVKEAKSLVEEAVDASDWKRYEEDVYNSDWGEWVEGESFLLEDWNKLCAPPPTPTHERETVKDKPYTLTMWKEPF